MTYLLKTNVSNQQNGLLENVITDLNGNGIVFTRVRIVSFVNSKGEEDVMGLVLLEHQGLYIAEIQVEEEYEIEDDNDDRN